MSEQPDPAPAIEDPEAYADHRRLKEIFDARELVRTARRQINIARTSDEISDYRASKYYHVVLVDYLQELEPLMTTKFPEAGRSTWEEEPLGTVWADPPEELQAGSNSPLSGHPRDGIQEIVEPAEPVSVDLVGLRSLVERSAPFYITFHAKGLPSMLSGQSDMVEIEETQPVTPPTVVLQRAYRLTNEFLAEIGLEVDPDDDKGQPFARNFDQSDGGSTARLDAVDYSGNPDL